MELTKTNLNDAYAKRTNIQALCSARNFTKLKSKIEWSANCDINNIKWVFWNSLEYVLNEKPTVLKKQFDEICEWLHSNDGKGLLLYGSCGQGKTILARYVIPAVLNLVHNKVTHYYEITDIQNNPNTLREAMYYGITIIDDVGTESQSSFKDMAFSRILDNADKSGKIVIATTNLSGEALRAHYGERNYDRICGNMKRVMFDGQISFRQK